MTCHANTIDYILASSFNRTYRHIRGVKARCLFFPSPSHTPFPIENLIFARLPTVAKNKWTCLRRKGSKPYFAATGVSHVLRRFDRRDVFEDAISHAYDRDNRARHHPDGRCLKQDCSDKDVDWRSESDPVFNADKLVPQLTYSTTQETKKEWRPSRHIWRDLKLEQEGRWITTGQYGRLWR